MVMQSGDPRCTGRLHIHICIAFRNGIVGCPGYFQFACIFQRYIKNSENFIDRLKSRSRKKLHGIFHILHIFDDKIPEVLTLCRIFRLHSGDLILLGFHIKFEIFSSKHGSPAFAFFIDVCKNRLSIFLT